MKHSNFQASSFRESSSPKHQTRISARFPSNLKVGPSLVLGCWCLVLLSCCNARAQYSLGWFTIDGGGGTSTGGVYSVSGTIGQPDAGAPMTGGKYSLTG